MRTVVRGRVPLFCFWCRGKGIRSGAYDERASACVSVIAETHKHKTRCQRHTIGGRGMRQEYSLSTLSFSFFFLLIVIWETNNTYNNVKVHTHIYTCSTIRRFLPTPRFACRCSLMSATSPRGPTRLAFLPGIRELPPEAARNVAAMPTSRRAVTP